MIFENSLIVSVKKAKHKRLFVLQEPLICVDNKGRRWVVPKGFRTDFASIPAIAKPFIPKAHQNSYAAVLHDFLYEHQPVSRAEADSLFHEALASPDCNTPPYKAWVMYRAVRMGGSKTWLKIKRNFLSKETKMADQAIIEEEKGLFAKFIDWLRKARQTVDEELDELDDEVRSRAKKLFRQANWPGIKEREILFQNKVKKSVAFKIAWALIFLSSCITLYYWWGAMPDYTSKFLIGFVFFFANLLMPLWARMTFWQGGTWLQPVVNFAGLVILLFVAGASIVASAGLQGTQSDYRESERTQQKLKYETQLAEAKSLKERIAELRKATTRAPNEIEAELNGLLLTEPKPQSACRSRENYGAWSVRNCGQVAKLRKEYSQADERVKLEKKASNLTFDNVPKVTVVDPQYQIVKRYTGVDKKTFNETKPLILAIIAELIFNGLTILLTITFGAEVREELKDRISRQRRDLISQAESEVDDERKARGDFDVNLTLDSNADPGNNFDLKPEFKPIEKTQIVETKSTDIARVIPEKIVTTVTETTREIKEGLTPDEQPSTPFLQATEPEQQVTPVVEQEPQLGPITVVEKEETLSVPTIQQTQVDESPVSTHLITEATDPGLVEKVKQLETQVQEQEAIKAIELENQEKLQRENLKLKFENLSNNRAVPVEVQQLAKYSSDRFEFRFGSSIDISFALKDYEAWCTKHGLAFNKPIEEFETLIGSDLGLIIGLNEAQKKVITNLSFRG